MKILNILRSVAVGTVAVIAVLSFSSGAWAQGNETASTNGTASARIVTSIALAAGTNNLVFGTFTYSGAGTVIIDAAANTQTASAAVSLVPGSLNVWTPGDFDVDGEVDASYTITFTGNESAAIITGGGVGSTERMELSNFNTDKVSNESTLPLGEDSFKVGATLTLTGDEIAGDYSGTYNVDVTYQ